MKAFSTGLTEYRDPHPFDDDIPLSPFSIPQSKDRSGPMFLQTGPRVVPEDHPRFLTAPYRDLLSVFSLYDTPSPDSPPQQELLGIHQPPHQVLQRRARVAGMLNQLQGPCPFRGVRQAAQGGQ